MDFPVPKLSALVTLLSLGACSQPPKPPPPAAYVNAATCAGCHPAIAKSYGATGMGRSLARPSASTVPLASATYVHLPSQSTFSIIQREGHFFQRRQQTGFDGAPANVLEKEIHYVMGSGHLVRTYLHRTPANKLVELPLSWYSEQGGRWAMSPGFDRAGHQGFRRAISTDCLFCHNAYPAGFVERRGEEPVFPSTLSAGIDCQRCHGPGREHVRLAQQPQPDPSAVRHAIVHPKRLTAERQLEICLQCHLETTSFPLPDALVRFGQPAFAYRPGQPLGDYKVYFDHASDAGRENKFEIVSAGYRLRQSACFTKSEGKLTCTTCHNPHGGPQPELAATCASCHAGPRRAGHPAGSACASCHMPQRRTEDVVHAVVTDHKIQRLKPAGDLLAARPERHDAEQTAYRGEVVAYYPSQIDELMLGAAQVVQQTNLLAGIPRLQAAIARQADATAEHPLILADALRAAGRLNEALPLYEEATRRDPSLIAARLQHGSALRQAGQPDAARKLLTAALAAAPDRPTGWYELGLAHLQANDRPAATAAFEKALTLDADMAEAHNALAGIWMAAGDPAKAEAAMREAVRIQPESADARNNLGSLLSMAGRLPEACFHFEAALRAQPRHLVSRFNYALALARSQRFDAAQKEAETAIQQDPQHAGAHQILGALLAGKGQTAAAIGHYREALRLRPDFGRALVGLAPLLAATGDTNGAAVLLQQARADADPAIRRQADALLSKGKH